MKSMALASLLLMTINAFADANVVIKAGQSINIRAGESTKVECVGAQNLMPRCELERDHGIPGSYFVRLDGQYWESFAGGTEAQNYKAAIKAMARLRSDKVCM